MDDDLVTTINPVSLVRCGLNNSNWKFTLKQFRLLFPVLFQTAAYQAKNENYLNKKILSFTLSSLSSFLITKTAKEILFDGYNDGILSVLSHVPGANVQEKFGIFYGVSMFSICNIPFRRGTIISVYTKSMHIYRVMLLYKVMFSQCTPKQTKTLADYWAWTTETIRIIIQALADEL